MNREVWPSSDTQEMVTASSFQIFLSFLLHPALLYFCFPHRSDRQTSGRSQSTLLKIHLLLLIFRAGGETGRGWDMQAGTLTMDLCSPVKAQSRGRLEPALLLELHQHSSKGQACEKALGQAPVFVRHVSPKAAQHPHSFPTLPGGSPSWEGAAKGE